jgi:hypothetical protein
MRALKESTKDLLIGLGDMLIPTISKLVEKVTGAVEWFGNLDSRWKKLILIVAGVAAAIGPVLLIVGQLTAAVSALVPVIIAVNAALAANPFGLIAIGVAAVAAGALLLIRNWDKVRLFFQKLYVRIVEFFEGLVDWVLKSPDWVAYLLAAFVPFIGLPMLLIKNWESFSDGMERIINAIVKFGIDAFNVMKTGILETMMGMLKGIRWILQKLGKETPKLNAAIGSLEQKINDTRNAAENLEYPTVELTDVFSKLADGAKELKESISELEEEEGELEEGQKKITEGAIKLGEGIEGVKKNIEKLIPNWKWYGAQHGILAANLKSLTELEERHIEVTDRQRDAWWKYYTLMKDYVTPICVTAKDKLTESTEEIKTVFENLSDYMETDFKNSVVSTMESVWASTGDFANKIKETIKGLLADILRGLGRKYAALAAAFFFQPLQALKYLAAAAALFAAAGGIERLAAGADFVTNGPQMVMVGDNPGGKERVQVTPLSSPNINGPKTTIVGPLVLEIDSTPIYKGMLKATEDGFALIDENAIVRQ